MYDESSLTNCEMCGEVNAPSGLLGNRIHYSCRACGWWYSTTNDNFEHDVTLDIEGA